MVYKSIFFAFILIVSALIFWVSIDIFLIAFTAILLAILFNAIGRGVQKVIPIPYVFSLLLGLIVIAGILTITFYLYFPLMAKQFQLLAEQLPASAKSLKEKLTPLLEQDIFKSDSFKNEIAAFNSTFLKKAVSLFSNILGALLSFAIIAIVAFYLAVFPARYIQGVNYLIPKRRQTKTWYVINTIDHSLRFWLLGKIFAMISIGVLTFLGLWILRIKLAFILALLAGLLTFIPYLGPIIAAIPAVLIGFGQGPLTALYVILVYLGIHIIEGYLITPYIEQKTVAIPPALSIVGQILFYGLMGPLGLILATPLIVVFMALVVSLKKHQFN